MGDNKRHFEKYQDFLQKRKINKSPIIDIDNDNFSNISPIFNITEPTYYNNHNKYKNKYKDDLNENQLEFNYNNYFDYNTDILKKKKNKISNNKDNKNSKSFQYSSNNINNKYFDKMNNNIILNNKNKNERINTNDNIINSYIDKYNKNNILKRNNTSNISKNKKLFKNNNFNNNLNNREKSNSINYSNNNYLKDNKIKIDNLNRNKNNNLVKKNKIKYNSSYDSSNSTSIYDPVYINKELDHLLSSYDFNNTKNFNNMNDIDDNSIKIHFRNLLYLVKELNAKNDLLKKEIKNKNDLISSLEKKLKKNNNIKKSGLNTDFKGNYDNILLDNDKLKSEILNLQNKLSNQKKYYDDLIGDYNKRIQEQKNKNKKIENKLKNIENKYKYSNNKIFDMKDDIKNISLMKAKLEDYNNKYEVINSEQQKKIEELEDQLRVIITLVKNLFNHENNVIYPMRNKLFYNISNLSKNN